MKKPSFRPSVLAVAIASLTSFSLFAEESVKEEDVERISVWSTAVKTSSLYLQGEEIANKQADHLSDLLRVIPGVDVGGAHSLNQRITIRSMDDKDLNISIDGATQNTYMYHHMGNLQIHADILKSVELEVGTNSVVYGGLGGSVRFETKQARDLLSTDENFGGRVQYTYGDNSGSNYSLTGYGLLSENVDFLVYYNDVTRDNYKVGGGEIKDGDGNLVPDTDGYVKGLEGDLDDTLIKLGWDITETQRLSFGYETYNDEGNYSFRPDMGLATDLAITNSLNVPLLWPTKFTRDTYTLNYDLTIDMTSVKASAFHNTSELWRDEMGWAENPNYAAWASVVTGEAQNQGANVIAQTVLDVNEQSHEFTYGFDYVKFDTSYLAEAQAGTLSSEEDASSLAFYVQDRWEFGNGFAVIPGVRYEQYDINSNVVNDDYSDTVFALAGEYQVTENFLVKVSTTGLFKGPELAEVFVGAGSDDEANPSIEAETGTNDEIAFAYQDEVLGVESLSLGATFFKTTIENFIYDYAPHAEYRYWKDNIGDLTVDGFEAYVGVKQGAFNAQVTYASADSEVDAFAEYASLDGNRLDRQQGDGVSATVGYYLEQVNLDLNWEVQQVSSVDAADALDSASLDNSKDGFTVHNISARWEPSQIDGLTIIFGVDNLFDEYYASQSSRTGTSVHPRFGPLYLLDYEPGRNIKATVAYQF